MAFEWLNPANWVPSARNDDREQLHAYNPETGEGGEQGIMDREHYGPSDPQSVAEGLNGQNGYNTAANPNAITDRYAGTSYEGQQTQRAYQNMSPDSTYDEKAFMYGRSPTGADEAADLALNTGSTAQAYGTQLGLMALGKGNQLNQDAQLRASQAQGRAPASGDWWKQNGALGQAAGYGGQLAGLEAQQGPSAAQAQLQAGTNQAMDSQIALARSGRGFGGGAAAAGLAQQNMAGIQANQANSAATLRAQEDAAWRGRQAANLGNAAGIQTAIGSQYGQESQADLSAELTSRGQNDAAALGWGAQGIDAWKSGTAANNDAWKAGVGANLAAQGQASGVRGQEMAGGQALANRQLSAWAARNGYTLQQEQMDNQKEAAYLSAGATAGAALIAASDIRGKTNIVPSDEAGRQFARGDNGAIDPDEFAAAHPGVATSYLTDQGRENYARNDALRLKHEAAGREFGEYGDDGLGKRSANYRANANSVAKGMAFDGTLYRPKGREQNPYAEPAGPTPMQQQFMGDEVSQPAAPAAPRRLGAPGSEGETTQLSPDEEAKFQGWAKANGVRDVDHPDSHYDYRGYFQQYGNEPHRSGTHFTDEFKQHGHPTFSNESNYSKAFDDGGYWEGEKFNKSARPDTSKPFDLDSMDASSLDAVRNSPASFYDYKDPGAPGADAQRHYGPMAQDLAKTPAGASAVVKQPDGSLGVDTGRLALVHNGAISAQQKQLDEIQAQLDSFSKKPSSVDPNQVYGGR